jgi:hypothetical protein
MQESEGESESSQGSGDEEERAASITPSATTSNGPSSFASRNEGSIGGKDKRIGRRRRRGRGTMKRGRRMSNLPFHQRTLGRKIQGRNPRGEGSLDRQLVC